MNELLVKKISKGTEKIFPKTYISGIYDKKTGKNLIDLLNSFNMYFLSYTGNTALTRCQVPKDLRREGLWITYVTYKHHVVTEWYNSNNIDNETWGSDTYWRQGSNKLIGDISISTNGNWVINGKETEFKATGDPIKPLLRVNFSINKLQVSYDDGNKYENLGDNPVYTLFRYNQGTNTIQLSVDLGKTWTNISDDNVFYKFRTADNKLQISTDLGKTWTDTSEPIAAWFRWTAADGTGNIGKVQISRNLLNWSDLSPVFTNNLYIKRYVATVGELPTSTAALGDIYMVGPTYDESDTTHNYPHYRMWVKQSDGWVDNGEYLSNVLVSQQFGNNSGTVISLKFITEWINKGYQFRGIATPATNPDTPDGPVFYLALDAGIYANFNNLEVTDTVCIFKWSNGIWLSEDTSIFTKVENFIFGHFCSDRFVRGNMVQGVISYTRTNRVCSDVIWNPTSTIKCSISEGFGLSVQYFKDGIFDHDDGWQYGSITIDKGSLFKVMIKRVSENPSEVADIEEFVNSVHIGVEGLSTHILSLQRNIDDINNKTDRINDAVKDKAEKSSVEALEETIGELKFNTTFVRGSLSQGVLLSRNNRIAEDAILKTIAGLNIKINEGFRISVQYFNNGIFNSDSGWQSVDYQIPADSEFKIMIARTIEDSSELADVDLFLSQIKVQYTNTTQSIGTALETVKLNKDLENNIKRRLYNNDIAIISAGTGTVPDPTGLTWNVLCSHRNLSLKPTFPVVDIDFSKYYEQRFSGIVFERGSVPPTISVSPNGMTFTNNSAERVVCMYKFAGSVVCPSIGICSKLVGGLTKRYGVGYVKDENNYIQVFLSKTDRMAKLTEKINGAVTEHKMVSSTIEADCTIYLYKGNYYAAGYIESEQGLTCIGEAEVSRDLNNIPNYAGYRPALCLDLDAGQSITIKDFCAGNTEGIGAADFRCITYDDGEPIMRDGCFFVTASTRIMGTNGGNGPIGIFKICPTSGQIEAHSFITTNHYGYAENGTAVKVVYDRAERTWIYIGRHNPAGPGGRLWIGKTKGCLINKGIHIVDISEVSQLANNSLDADLIKIKDTWYCCYHGGNPRLCHIAKSSDLKNWTDILSQSTGEGLTFAKFNGKYFVMDARSKEELGVSLFDNANETLTYIGNINMPDNMGSGSPYISGHPWGCLVPYYDGERCRFYYIGFTKEHYNPSIEQDYTYGEMFVYKASESWKGEAEFSQDKLYQSLWI